MSRYRVLFAVELEADSPEEAAGAATVELALGAYEFVSVEQAKDGS